jgi:hypothetical protein
MPNYGIRYNLTEEKAKGIKMADITMCGGENCLVKYNCYYDTATQMQTDMHNLLKEVKAKGKVIVHVKDTDTVYHIISEPLYSKTVSDLRTALNKL